MEDKKLSHIDGKGNPAMVDVGEKQVTKRSATARSILQLGKEIVQEISDEEIKTKKGPVFQTAIIAGTMAVKKTSDLIPMCHPLAIEKCKFKIEVISDTEVQIDCTVSLHGKTGVEMEALTGVTVAALTVYDMCKAMSHEIVISNTHLVEKTGGKSGFRTKN